MNSLRFSLAFALFLAGEVYSKVCPAGWIDASKADLDCLLVTPNPSTWPEARVQCNNLGGRIVSIKKEKQLKFLQSYFLSKKTYLAITSYGLMEITLLKT